MSAIENKIDFALLVTVDKANPNGDPLNGNRPREDFDGYGEISDVCIKRKLRNRLQDMGEKVFVQSADRSDDGKKSLSERAKSNSELQAAVKAKDIDAFNRVACESWIDVRSFGQVFAFKGNDTLSTGVRGPVSVRTAESVSPIDISSMQITKSVNSETTKDGKKSSDTMGIKNRVEFGLYVIKGSINPQLAEKTGFSEEDADKIKEALLTLFENDASSARPEGSIEVRRLYWWKHNCKAGQCSTAKVHRSLVIKPKDGIEVPKQFEDYDVSLIPIEDLEPEIIEGK
jgi:CRISPR-associated protein Csd2